MLFFPQEQKPFCKSCHKTSLTLTEAEEWLEANLPPEARARLERLAAARAERDFRYERALFRCGLGLGLELAGSGRLPG